MGTRKTSVEIDEELLDAARRILETTSVKATVEGAFREVVRAEARRQEIESLTSMRELDLADSVLAFDFNLVLPAHTLTSRYSCKYRSRFSADGHSMPSHYRSAPCRRPFTEACRA